MEAGLSRQPLVSKQRGRRATELADLSNLTNGVTVGVTPSTVIDLAVDVMPRARSISARTSPTETTRSRRTSPGGVNKKMSLVSNVSFNLGGAMSQTRGVIGTPISTSVFIPVRQGEGPVSSKVSGQFSIRSNTNTFAPISKLSHWSERS